MRDGFFLVLLLLAGTPIAAQAQYLYDYGESTIDGDSIYALAVREWPGNASRAV